MLLCCFHGRPSSSNIPKQTSSDPNRCYTARCSQSTLATATSPLVPAPLPLYKEAIPETNRANINVGLGNPGCRGCVERRNTERTPPVLARDRLRPAISPPWHTPVSTKPPAVSHPKTAYGYGTLPRLLTFAFFLKYQPLVFSTGPVMTGKRVTGRLVALLNTRPLKSERLSVSRTL